MKKLLFIAVALFSFCSYGQYFENGWISEGKTTAEIQAQGNIVGKFEYNSQTGSLWLNNGTTWVDLGAGASYIFSTGLTNTSGTITVTNPFEEADETKLDGIATGATVGADWNTNLSNIPANLDLDGSGTNVTAGTNTTVTGTGTTGDPYVVSSTASGTGDVTAASAFGTDNRIIRSDGTGKGVQSSGITIDDSNGISGVGSYSGATATLSGNLRLGYLANSGQTLKVNANGDVYSELVSSGSGDVTGPASSTDNTIPRFDGADGKTLQTSPLEILDNGNIDMNANAITGMADPTNPSDAATKNYVDANDDTGTDSQTLSLGGTGNRSLSISGGNTVDLSGVSITTGQLTGTLATGNYADDSVTPAKIAPSSTDGQVLKTVGSDVVWADAGSGTDSGQTKTYETGSSKTLTLADFLEGGSLTGRGKVILHTANDTITTPTGLGQTGRYVTALHLLRGADSVYIKKGSGATLINSTIAYNGSGVSEDGIWATTDFLISITPSGAFEVDGSDTFLAHTEVAPNPELYTVANALSTTNEADATTALGNPSGGVITSIESSPSPQDGTSLIQFTEQSAADRLEVDMTLTDGETYVVEYWAWESSGGNGSSFSWTGVTSSPNQGYTETPTKYTHTITMSGTALKMRFYANTTGTTIYLDGLSVKVQL